MQEGLAGMRSIHVFFVYMLHVVHLLHDCKLYGDVTAACSF